MSNARVSSDRFDRRVMLAAVAVLVACGSETASKSGDAQGGRSNEAAGGSSLGGASVGTNGGASVETNGGASHGGASNGGSVGRGGSNAADGGRVSNGGRSSASAGGGVGGGGSGSGTSPCTALPPANGAVIEVNPSQANELPKIVRDAVAGSTIVLASGTYRMSGSDEASRRIQILADGVTLRSKSGDRDAVLIDGEYRTEEIITISASHVTLADFSIAHAINHPVHVTGGAKQNTTGTLLHNLHIVDGGEQFVKVNTGGGNPTTYADEGRLECSLLEMTDAGRPHVAPEPGGCYTGGIDGHQARGWVVRRNEFRGIHCTNGSLAEHAVHFWTSSRDTLVEQNIIVDCARGVGFGLGDGGGKPPERSYADDPYPGIGYVGHYDGIIRNNVIVASSGFAYFDTGIELEQAHGVRVLHNSIVHGTNAFASISHRFTNSQVTLINNLVQNIRARDGSLSTLASNVEQAGAALFVDAANADLHLRPSASAAINQGAMLPDAGRDIDDEPHDGALPDIGADELSAP